jgi:hypothetical protein
VARSFVLDRRDTRYLEAVERLAMAPVLADALDAERLADVLVERLEAPKDPAPPLRSAPPLPAF